MNRTGFTSMVVAAIAAAFLLGGEAGATSRPGFELDVVVDGSPRREYYSGGTIYVEALRDREYTLRLTNPTGRRVAVALSVDGLNTIDAKHTAAREAAKWVIGPYGSIEISGWQVSDRAARSFVFTGERSSYGAALGKTENLGVIEAVFFLEREPEVSWWSPRRGAEPQNRPEAAPAPSAAGASRDSAEANAKSAPVPDDEYAATGMGDKRRHDVRAVEMKLEDRPVESIRIRYEFRKQLVALGILPEPVTPLDRRERARGFDGYCPEPGVRRD
jgi:hypothetical protein